jgi:NAD(P)-dependent dehydrogenase (short-subunit alcohol dehydrogenase family)
MAVWFITGAARGFGRELVVALLRAGDHVIATARQPEDVTKDFPDAGEALLALPLDVTDPGQVEEAVRAGLARFGRVDVLVNNAGYGLFGSVEETSDAEVRRLFDTNVFGLLAVTRALLPTFRGQGSGHVLNMSSSAGFSVGAGRGLYGASKFAVEAISEALHAELAPLGVHVSVIEPGSFRTDFLSCKSRFGVPVSIDDYSKTVGPLITAIESNGGRQPGDPAKAAAAILEIAALADPPFRLQLGSDAVKLVEDKLQTVQASTDQWRALSLSTDFPTSNSPEH